MSDRKQVLIVDDSMVSRMMVFAIIKDAHPDWDISQAADADEAINMENLADCDYVTLDMNMPGKTGLEIAPALISAAPHAKIALLTANIQDYVKMESQRLGIELIAKPITEEKILNFI
ncbi:MAG: response regulator transcription factor [Spongiibacteraceae bacterium]|nr:response regulator transcription factor [Spongiibacteraceae bacterium]